MNKSEFNLAALKNSTSQLFAEKVIPRAKLTTTNSLDEAVGMLIENRIDALIADYPFCAVAAFRYQEKGLIAGKARFTFEPLGIALSANDPLLINWVENFLAGLKGTGSLEGLTNRWFKNASWLKKLP
jgi:polar amino acid transport system substrate-binding protein